MLLLYVMMSWSRHTKWVPVLVLPSSELPITVDRSPLLGLGGWWWPCCGQVSGSATNYSSNTMIWSIPTVNKYSWIFIPCSSIRWVFSFYKRKFRQLQRNLELKRKDVSLYWATKSNLRGLLFLFLRRLLGLHLYLHCADLFLLHLEFIVLDILMFDSYTQLEES